MDIPSITRLFKQRFKQKYNPDEERRKNKRIKNSLDLSVQVSNERNQIISRSRDISEGGMRICFYHHPALGTFLKIWIGFPVCGEPLLVAGKVIWVQETKGSDFPIEAGIEFKTMGSQARDKINDYIGCLTKRREDEHQRLLH